jgi:acyl carrier protein
VKVRGYRIELGEIEAVLGQYWAVREAVVIVREDEEGEKRLVAYVVTEEGVEPGSHELRSYLKEKLPEYMIPSLFVLLDELPLTANGKVDRRALPAPDHQHIESHRSYVAPQTPVEELLASIWSEVLHVEQVGIHDNFFDLGGHSLLVTRLHAGLQEHFQQKLTLLDIFKYPTINTLAQYLTQPSTSSGDEFKEEQGGLEEIKPTPRENDRQGRKRRREFMKNLRAEEGDDDDVE